MVLGNGFFYFFIPVSLIKFRLHSEQKTILIMARVVKKTGPQQSSLSGNFSNKASEAKTEKIVVGETAAKILKRGGLMDSSQKAKKQKVETPGFLPLMKFPLTESMEEVEEEDQDKLKAEQERDYGFHYAPGSLAMTPAEFSKVIQCYDLSNKQVSVQTTKSGKNEGKRNLFVDDDWGCHLDKIHAMPKKKATNTAATRAQAPTNANLIAEIKELKELVKVLWDAHNELHEYVYSERPVVPNTPVLYD